MTYIIENLKKIISRVLMEKDCFFLANKFYTWICVHEMFCKKYWYKPSLFDTVFLYFCTTVF